ncbi:hypothetical protein Ocin01_13215 [Orchesella cincta]|uniref:F-box domain-containing protein n=1 Tax=Orchesella cincta TaxID=48709 RepID=A0A1D2MKN9_ORCCI|nr:hypothetical protein Ocin01_13215 [Orchesella cincta]
MSLMSNFLRLFGLDPPPPDKSFGGLPPLLMLSPVDLRVISPASRELDSIAPAPSSSMDRLPPEVLIKVLEWLVLVERNRNDLLRYRLISSKWKVLLDPLIEQKIISRELTPFPELKDVQIGENGTHPVSVPPNLFRDGGGYLTSFSYSQEFWLKDLISILGCMPNLNGSAYFCDSIRRRHKAHICFPSATILFPSSPPWICSYPLGWEDTYDNDSTMVLSIWMILSYADQLVRLTVWAEYPLPALQQNQNYYHHLDTGARIFIATTSDSAFGKLSELEISRPNKSFLLLTQTPALRRFTVTSSDDRRRSRVNFWREPSPSMVALPLVKTLVLTYAAFYEKVIVNKTLNLGKFPALEKLHLLRFRADVYEPERDREADLGSQYEALVTETVGYPPLIVSRVRSLRGLIKGVRTRIENNMEIVEEQRRQMVDSHERMFAALRGNDEEDLEVIVRKLLESEGIWNSCPKLKIVSVSSHGRSDGDVCIIRRLEENSSEN